MGRSSADVECTERDLPHHVPKDATLPSTQPDSARALVDRTSRPRLVEIRLGL